jgi:hypothetical protein
MLEVIIVLLRQAVESFTLFNQQVQSIKVKRNEAPSDQDNFMQFKVKYDQHKQNIFDLCELLGFEGSSHDFLEASVRWAELGDLNVVESKKEIFQRERNLRRIIFTLAIAPMSTTPICLTNFLAFAEQTQTYLQSPLTRRQAGEGSITATRKDLLEKVFNTQKTNIITLLNRDCNTTLIQLINNIKFDDPNLSDKIRMILGLYVSHNQEQTDGGVPDLAPAGGASAKAQDSTEDDDDDEEYALSTSAEQKTSTGKGKARAIRKQPALRDAEHLNIEQVKRMCLLLAIDSEDIIDKVDLEGEGMHQEIDSQTTFAQALTSLDAESVGVNKTIIFKVKFLQGQHGQLKSGEADDFDPANHYVAVKVSKTDTGYDVVYIDPTGRDINEAVAGVLTTALVGTVTVTSSNLKLQALGEAYKHAGIEVGADGNDYDCGVLLPLLLACPAARSPAAVVDRDLSVEQTNILGKILRKLYNESLAGEAAATAGSVSNIISAIEAALVAEIAKPESLQIATRGSANGERGLDADLVRNLVGLYNHPIFACIGKRYEGMCWIEDEPPQENIDIIKATIISTLAESGVGASSSVETGSADEEGDVSISSAGAGSADESAASSSSAAAGTGTGTGIGYSATNNSDM